MKISIQQVAKITAGTFLNNIPNECQIETLLLDSRSIGDATNAIFIAIKGKYRNGHDYIPLLCSQGVKNFIVSDKINIDDFVGVNFIKVSDTLSALQLLATWRRHQFNIPVIGITGSNGKTIVKEWLYQLLHHDYNIVKSPKSYNSQIGVPLSVWQMSAEHTLAIFEAGISQPNEMQHLAPIIDCQIGIFTNIGDAHSEGFENIHIKIKEKLKLFKNTKTLIYCCDDERINKIIREEVFAIKFFSWSREGGGDLNIQKTTPINQHKTIIQADYNQKTIEIEIPFGDNAAIENAINCWALMLHLNYENHLIRERMLQLSPVAMRLELKAGVNQCLIINDAYNADLASLQIAMDFVKQQGNLTKHTLILSDILQSGLSEQKLYNEVKKLFLQKKFSRFIGIGTQIQLLDKMFPDELEKKFYKDTNDFLAKTQSNDFNKEIVLIKGARSFELEKIAERLAQKAHKTVLEINLNALIHNLSIYRDLVKPTTKLMAMVKASAYGTGGVEVAQLLALKGVDYLAVAYADEGIELRNHGITLPILVLNPEPDSFDAIKRYQLEPEIYSLGQFQQFLDYHGKADEASIHLKLDTGMHRLGFEENDITNLITLLNDYPKIIVKSIFSHLAASESSVHDDFTNNQIKTFQYIYDNISNALGYSPIKHILNSSGIVRFPEFQMDMVRLGIGLYGIDSSGILQSQLQTVQTLKASISQIKSISKGATIGYNRKGIAKEAMKIATISIGYADGLLRAAGNGAYSVKVRGYSAPIVGNICMDMTMIDVSNIPNVAEGDEVIVFGNNPTVQELANVLNTIPYEVFTGISDRVKRIYFQE